MRLADRIAEGLSRRESERARRRARVVKVEVPAEVSEAFAAAWRSDGDRRHVAAAERLRPLLTARKFAAIDAARRDE